MNNLARHETRFNAQTDSLGVGDDKIAFVMLSIVSPFMSSADEGGAASTWLMDGLPSVCTRTKAKAFRRRMVSVGSVDRCPGTCWDWPIKPKEAVPSLSGRPHQPQLGKVRLSAQRGRRDSKQESC